MSRLSIAVDLDDIVTDFHGKLLGEYNAQFGRAVTIADMTTWDLHEAVPDGRAIYGVFSGQGFFVDVPALPGAIESLQYLLDEGHDVVLLSAATDWALKDKATWVERFAPFMRDRTFFSVRKTPKHRVAADVLIDDGPHNILAYRTAHPKAFITGIEYPYMTSVGRLAANTLYSYQDPRRAWKQMVRDIEQFAERK